jgi:hypothetical protein
MSDVSVIDASPTLESGNTPDSCTSCSRRPGQNVALSVHHHCGGGTVSWPGTGVSGDPEGEGTAVLALSVLDPGEAASPPAADPDGAPEGTTAGEEAGELAGLWTAGELAATLAGTLATGVVALASAFAWSTTLCAAAWPRRR